MKNPQCKQWTLFYWSWKHSDNAKLVVSNLFSNYHWRIVGSLQFFQAPRHWFVNIFQSYLEAQWYQLNLYRLCSCLSGYNIKEKSMCTTLDGWYLLFVVAFESGRHPIWYDHRHIITYSYYMPMGMTHWWYTFCLWKQKVLSAKRQLKNKVYFNASKSRLNNTKVCF